MLFLVATSPQSLLAQNQTGSEIALSMHGLDSNFSELDSSKNRKVFYPGMRTGIPYFFGFRYEWILKRDADLMPVYLLTGDISATLGYGISLALERRIGHTSFYAGCGYNFTQILIPWSAIGLHSMLLTIGQRSSYQKQKVFNYSIGVLMTPLSFDHYFVFPLLSISVAGN